VWLTAIAYFGLGSQFWGNPNSLGVAMSVGAFPILLWGWFTSEPGLARWRRLLGLLVCTFLSFFSLERAGMVAIAALTLAFCFCIRQYKLLMKVALLALGAIGVIGMVKPAALSEVAVSIQDAILYKGGHKEEGVLGSRRAPWEKTISNIKQNPWFGTGYGTSPTGEDIGFGSGTYSSSAETAREHGSSYMTIFEWMGLLGVLPFVLLMGLNVFHILKVGLWLHRTGLASHYSVPLAMVLFAGFIHASFEDWMFAPGSYFCVYFWTLAFILTDLLPRTGVAAPVPRPVCGTSPPERMPVEAIVSSR
jgi:O-antigen ligase